MKNRIAAAATAAAFTALCFSAGAAADAARRALALCAGTILPALFPFFVLSILLSRLGLPRRLGARLSPLTEKLFGVSGAGAAALPVGLLGGYPLGAACAAELLEQGEIDAEEAGRLLLFCNNSGPAFLVGAVGSGVFHSTAAGLLLYAAHAAAAILTGLLFRRTGRASGAGAAPAPQPFSAAFPAAVKQAVGAVLTVCGFVVCFTVLLELLNAWGLPAALGIRSQAGRTLLAGFLEIGSAVGVMQGLSPTPPNLALAAGVLGWGGLSVHCQTAALFSERELSLRPHLLGRLCSALFSALLAGGTAALTGRLGI